MLNEIGQNRRVDDIVERIEGTLGQARDAVAGAAFGAVGIYEKAKGKLAFALVTASALLAACGPDQGQTPVPPTVEPRVETPVSPKPTERPTGVPTAGLELTPTAPATENANIWTIGADLPGMGGEETSVNPFYLPTGRQVEQVVDKYTFLRREGDGVIAQRVCLGNGLCFINGTFLDRVTGIDGRVYVFVPVESQPGGIVYRSPGSMDKMVWVNLFPDEVGSGQLPEGSIFSVVLNNNTRALRGLWIDLNGKSKEVGGHLFQVPSSAEVVVDLSRGLVRVDDQVTTLWEVPEDRSSWPQLIREAVGPTHDFVQYNPSNKSWYFSGMTGDVRTDPVEMTLPDGRKMTSWVWWEMFYPFQENGEWKLGVGKVSLLTEMPNGRLVAYGVVDYGVASDPSSVPALLYVLKEQYKCQKRIVVNVTFSLDPAASYKATGWTYGEINGYGEAVTAYQSDPTRQKALKEFTQNDTPLPEDMMLLPVDMYPNECSWRQRVNLGEVEN